MKDKGITLVALVITIIILIILVAVSINIVFGPEGLIEKSKQGATDYKVAAGEEQNLLADINAIVVGENFYDGMSGAEVSNIIGDFDMEITKIFATTMTVKVNNINNSQVKGYIYFVNNKVARVSEDSEVKISNLTKETQYNNIYVIAIDENGRFKRSSNTLEATTTSNYYARWKEYKSAQGTYEANLIDSEGFSVTGNSITIPETETYHFEYSWWAKGWTENAHWLKVFQNGTEVKKLSPTNNVKKSGSFDLELEQGDVIVVKQYTDSSNYPTSIDLIVYSDIAPVEVDAEI